MAKSTRFPQCRECRGWTAPISACTKSEFSKAFSLIVMAVHGAVQYFVETEVSKVPGKEVVSNYVVNLRNIIAAS